MKNFILKLESSIIACCRFCWKFKKSYPELIIQIYWKRFLKIFTDFRSFYNLWLWTLAPNDRKFLFLKFSARLPCRWSKFTKQIKTRFDISTVKLFVFYDIKDHSCIVSNSEIMEYELCTWNKSVLSEAASIKKPLNKI